MQQSLLHQKHNLFMPCPSYHSPLCLECIYHFTSLKWSERKITIWWKVHICTTFPFSIVWFIVICFLYTMRGCCYDCYSLKRNLKIWIKTAGERIVLLPGHRISLEAHKVKQTLKHLARLPVSSIWCGEKCLCCSLAGATCWGHYNWQDHHLPSPPIFLW